MTKRWLIFSALCMLLLVGCNKETEEAVKVQDEQKEQETEVEDQADELMPYSFPLTGVGTKDEPIGRAYAVMINNDPKARPHSGLHKADIVYELLAEGNITRFIAIFQSEKAERIGPVRSARDYFIELAKGYDALYVAHGYSPEAKKMLDNGYVDHINGMQYDGTYFKRDSSRVAPHNSYITTENVLKGAEKVGAEMDKIPEPLTFLTADEIEQLNGEKAHSLKISYFSSNLFNVVYEYDDELQKYKRFTNGEQTIDSDSKEPVLLDNIFILETKHRIIDDAGRREIDITSGGDGYLIQKGQWKKVEWKNIDGKLLPYENGKQAGLVPGKTWINVVPVEQGLETVVTFEQ